MAGITKRVNIKAPVAVRNITPPIYGTCNNIIMTSGDILKCLCKRAQVEEILPDGSIVKITMKNYYTDNGAGLNAYAWNPEAVEEPKTANNEEAHIEFANTEIGKEKETNNMEANVETDGAVTESSEPDAETPENAVVDTVVDGATEDNAGENVEPVIAGAAEVVETDNEKVETDDSTAEPDAETTENAVVDSVEGAEEEETKEDPAAKDTDAEKEVVDDAKKPAETPAPKKKTSSNKKSTKK